MIRRRKLGEREGEGVTTERLKVGGGGNDDERGGGGGDDAVGKRRGRREG